MLEHERFQRAELLFGEEGMTGIFAKRVILFGVGGVGSWCAEALVRSGIHHLTLVDCDCVCESNINRQLMATVETVGRPKVDVLRERLLTINPDADITALQRMFNADTAADFNIGSYDFVIDAIDSLKDKALLIKMTCDTDAQLFSSMGAALKMDTSHIQVAEFWKVKGDSLARALRNYFKRNKMLPRRKFMCVFSDEPPLPNIGDKMADNSAASSQLAQKRPNGSLAHITGIFGFTLAGLVLNACRVSE